jgi:hypothetical protein
MARERWAREVMEVDRFDGCLNHEWREFYELNEGCQNG